MDEVGRYILRQACLQGAAWRDGIAPDLAVGVNVSARQLAGDTLVDDVAQALAAARLEPAALILEITETAMMRDTGVAKRNLMALDEIGVRLALDDFGTGYSSLTHLQQFPIGIVKIDKSFVAGIGTPRHRTLVAGGDRATRHDLGPPDRGRRRRDRRADRRAPRPGLRSGPGLPVLSDRWLRRHSPTSCSTVSTGRCPDRPEHATCVPGVTAGRVRDCAAMDKPKALVTAPFRDAGLDLLRSLCSEVVLDPWIDHRPLRLYNSEQLAERIVAEGATLLVVESDSVKGPVLELPLVAIGSCRGDPTNVDMPAATRAGIPVLRAPGRNADAVAEITVGLLFAVNRGIVRADMDVREGQVWRDGTIPYQRFRAWELAGRTAGIVGLGAVGRATKWRLEGLGMHVITADPYAPDATHSLDELLAEADVVSMHAAVTPETEGLIGAAQFAAMKEGAIYVNSATRAAARHRRAGHRAAVRQAGRRRARPLRR